MRVSILKFVFFSIIICFFEYVKNELYYINERNIYHERNITNFRNNRILGDTDNRFDLNYFYESTLSLANQLNEYNDDDDEEIKYLRNIIDSHVKKHKENNTLPDLNSLDKRTKKLIDELHKEIEETKKELDNIKNNKLAIELIQNNPVSEEDFKQLKNERNIVGTEHYGGDSNIENESKTKRKLTKLTKKLMVRGVLLTLLVLSLLVPGLIYFVFVIMNVVLSIEIIIECCKYVKFFFKEYKSYKKKKKSR
ncbi:fam-b protein [Plasmodium yoelii]|uniref:Fam-b protein n=2 Tax=Plasmodium yoelii TaxID=5861 RepID=A0AAE9WM43_PLAYO|nr:fam-b protein [Plasmodium yoelii]WBY55461.1 fam-b protein [Plasmodium yoelii yoelii]VTZ73958.1 fam-b protein [Plasmodium yoelii]|eukprot:XP_034493390.1 fam-b protein [Plasmodium yoelii]